MGLYGTRLVSRHAWGARGDPPLCSQLIHGSSPPAGLLHPPAFPSPRDELEFRGADPERLRESEDTLDVLLEDEGGLGSRHSPPASPRGGSPVLGR